MAALVMFACAACQQARSPSTPVEEKSAVETPPTDEDRAKFTGAIDSWLEQKRSGKWSVSESRSEFDDSPTVVLALEGERPIEGWLTDPVLPTLILRCQEGKTESYVVSKMRPISAAGRDSATVRLRFDGSPPVENPSSVSTDGEAMFLANAIGTIRTMIGSERMLLQFTPFNGSPQTTEFDLRGLADVIGPLQDACGWETAVSPPPPPPVRRTGIPDMFWAFERSPFYRRHGLKPVGELFAQEGEYEQRYSVGSSGEVTVRLWLGNGGVGLAQADGNYGASFHQDFERVKTDLGRWVTR